MTDYTTWKILKSEYSEHREEYADVADWCNETQQYTIEDDGTYYKVVPILPPTHEEIRKQRELAYAVEVDCITAHIQRLRDEEQTPEVVEEISTLIAERNAKVEEIKELYPYPEESE